MQNHVSRKIIENNKEKEYSNKNYSEVSALTQLIVKNLQFLNQNFYNNEYCDVKWLFVNY